MSMRLPFGQLFRIACGISKRSTFGLGLGIGILWRLGWSAIGYGRFQRHL